MSIFDTLFGNNATTSETRTALTGPATEAATNLFGSANAYATQPYSQYSGSQIAGFTPTQLSAFNAANAISNDTNGIYGQLSKLVTEGTQNRQALQGSMNQQAGNSNALANEGIGAVRDLAVAFPNANISQYMNPYVQDVLDPAIRDLTREAEQNRQQLAARSAMTGSFGGSRNALAQSQAQQGTQEELARLSANERAKAFTAATEQFRADQSAIPALYAAGQGLATNAQGALVNADNFQRLGYQDLQNLQAANAGRLETQVNPLLTVGGLEQGLNQSAIDRNIANFNAERDWGSRGINALVQAFGAGSGATGQTTNSTITPPQANPVGQVVGTVAGLTGALGGLGGVANTAGSAINWLGNQASSWFTPTAESFTNTVPDVVSSSGASLFGPGFKRGGLVALPTS